MDDSKKLSLITNLSISERFLKKCFLGVLKIKGMKNSKPEPKMNENGENFRVFRKQSYCYEENGEKIYRNIACKDGLVDSIAAVETINDLFEHSVAKNGNSDFMGVRSIISEEEYSVSFNKTVSRYHFGPYNWISYATGKIKYHNLVSLFLSYDINIERKVGLFLDTSPTWLLSALALFKIKSPVVTLFSTLSDENLAYALNLTTAVAVVVDKKSANRLSKLMNNVPSLEIVFCAPCCPKNTCKFLRDDNKEIKVIYLADSDLMKPLTDENKAKIDSYKPVSNDIALIMFTSGSTGFPKGVILTHQNLISSVATSQEENEFWSKQVYIGYLPLSHIFEFLAELVMMTYGAKIGYGNPLSLFSTSPMIIPGTTGDLEELHPTFFCTVPLLVERVKKLLFDKLKSSPRSKQLLFQLAYNKKLQYMKAGLSTDYLDQLIFKKSSAALGGQVKHSFIGGALLDEASEEFINIAFNGLFKQAYGLTETCCAGTLSNLDYWSTGNTGPVAKCVEIKLVPWEEGNYDPNNPENPCGHILISGKSVFQGYWGMPGITNEAFIKDEKTGKVWFKTGDIGQLRPDGTFKIIDRLKDIIKLKHGEYVALAHIEEALNRCALIDMTFVGPNSTMDYLVALVLPNLKATKGFFDRLDEKYQTMSEEELINDKDVQEIIIEEIVKTYTQDKKLDKYEIPKRIHIITDLWTPESGLLTPSAKFRRAHIANKYKELLI